MYNKQDKINIAIVALVSSAILTVISIHASKAGLFHRRYSLHALKKLMHDAVFWMLLTSFFAISIFTIYLALQKKESSKLQNKNNERNLINTPEDKFQEAILANDAKETSDLLENGKISVNQELKCGKKPINFAAINSDEEILELLIKHGASPSEALRECIANGNLKNVEFLIKKLNHSINEQDESGKTLLHLATSHNHLCIIELLLKNRPKINLPDHNGDTPLHIAIKNHNNESDTKIVKTLITNGAKIDYKAIELLKANLTQKELIDLLPTIRIAKIIGELFAKLYISECENQGIKNMDDLVVNLPSFDLCTSESIKYLSKKFDNSVKINTRHNIEAIKRWVLHMLVLASEYKRETKVMTNPRELSNDANNRLVELESKPDILYNDNKIEISIKQLEQSLNQCNNDLLNGYNSEGEERRTEDKDSNLKRSMSCIALNGTEEKIATKDSKRFSFPGLFHKLKRNKRHKTVDISHSVKESSNNSGYLNSKDFEVDGVSITNCNLIGM